MNALRGGLLILVSIVLFLSLFVGVLFLIISLSLNYDNVKQEMVPALKDTFSGQIQIKQAINNDYFRMENYCNTYSNYVVSYEGESVVIPCNIILEGRDAVVDYGIDQFIQGIYFDRYDCSFISCFRESKIPFFLISKKTQEDFYTNFNLILLLVAVISILGFLLSEKKSNFFILLSSLLVLAALPFFKLDWLINTFGAELKGLLSVFFNKSYAVFLGVAIVGVVLLLIGIVLKFFNIGFDISTIFSGKSKGKKGKDDKGDEEKEGKPEKKGKKKGKKSGKKKKK